MAQRGAGWWRCRAWSLLPAMLLVTSTAAAQQGVTGRWRIDVTELSPAPVFGELVLADSAGLLVGRAALSSNNGPPVSLVHAVLDQAGVVSFTIPGPGGATFSGRLGEGSLLRGDVRSDDGRRGHWTANRLDPSIEFYPVLPAFRLRQLVGGIGAEHAFLPPAFVAAASAEAPRAALQATYDDRARASGVPALSGMALQRDAAPRLLGVEQRTIVLAAVQKTLLQLRGALPDDSARAVFDITFRPGGRWRLDLHDAALDVARQRARTLEWKNLVPALRGTGLVPDSVPTTGAILLAIQRLLLIERADSAGTAQLLAAATRADPVSARQLKILLASYPEAEAWDAQAITFLLRSRWVLAGGTSRSPTDVVRVTWLAIMPGDSGRVASLPVIEPRRFGQPQAVPRYGASSASMARLLTAENWSGRQWLARHGMPEMLTVLHELESPGRADLLVARDGELLQVVSVKRRAAESMSGFLERQDAIAVEAEYVPVLALGAILHEWGHLLAEGWRFDRAVGAAPDSGEVVLPALNPWLVEGIAEVWTDVVLEPIVARAPLVGLAEAEKRVRLSGDENDPHVTGYLMARAAVRAGRAKGATTAESLRHLIEAGDPGRVLSDSLFSGSVRDPGGDVVPLIVSAPSRRFLVPESIFTVDTRYPDPVSSIIRTPRP